ncbi:hypothetical protein HMPREF2137_02655 [Hoylesella buccalis DNF00853]|uniref:Uncharacterized protein n=1 Tax=Hoylesella buccalis DNF00853 TaxID=1401074 RepID=A0A095ZP71_9BACT|nr:hypothetical protein HMPREF2137_02655 [Hoylesella buccalis DNF00853]
MLINRNSEFTKKTKFYLSTLTLILSLNLSAAIQPRPEYPRPQFERTEWINLNGDAWTYQFDFGKSGIYTYNRERKFDMDRIKKIFSKSREQAKKEVADMLKKH